MLKNLGIEAYVRHDCNWGDALVDALSLAIKNDIAVRVNYRNQHIWVITPETTKEEIEKMKEQKIVIGL